MPIADWRGGEQPFLDLRDAVGPSRLLLVQKRNEQPVELLRLFDRQKVAGAGDVLVIHVGKVRLHVFTVAGAGRG